MTGPSVFDALQPDRWPTFALVSGRVVGLMLAAPLWSLAAIPRTARAAIAVILTLAILPGVPAAAIPSDFPGIPVLLASEMMIGVGIGLSAAFLLHALALAGEVVALQMALNLGQTLSPMSEVGGQGLGEIKSLFALSCFVALGGHLTLLAAVGGSFASIPPGGAIDLARGASTLVAMAGTVFSTAIRAAAPVMVALLLVNLVFAILTRAVPNVSTMALAFPVTIGLGLIAMGASLPLLGRVIAGSTAGTGLRAAAVIEAFTPAGGR